MQSHDKSQSTHSPHSSFTQRFLTASATHSNVFTFSFDFRKNFHKKEFFTFYFSDGFFFSNFFTVIHLASSSLSSSSSSSPSSLVSPLANYHPQSSILKISNFSSTTFFASFFLLLSLGSAGWALVFGSIDRHKIISTNFEWIVKNSSNYEFIIRQPAHRTIQSHIVLLIACFHRDYWTV